MSMTKLNPILHLLQLHGFIVEECSCWTELPAVQTFYLLKMVPHSVNVFYGLLVYEMVNHYILGSNLFGSGFVDLTVMLLMVLINHISCSCHIFTLFFNKNVILFSSDAFYMSNQHNKAKGQHKKIQKFNDSSFVFLQVRQKKQTFKAFLKTRTLLTVSSMDQ